jgi:hypothetical protein
MNPNANRLDTSAPINLSDPLEPSNSIPTDGVLPFCKPPQQPLRIDRWPSSLAIEWLQFLTDKIEIHVPVDRAQKMILRYVVLDSKVVKERLRSALLSHHIEPPAPTSPSCEKVPRTTRKNSASASEQCRVFQQLQNKRTPDDTLYLSSRGIRRLSITHNS